MNNDDRKVLKEAREKLEEAKDMIGEIGMQLEERIDNIMETFESGNHVSEKLEEEVSTLDEIKDSIDTAQLEIDEVVA